MKYLLLSKRQILSGIQRFFTIEFEIWGIWNLTYQWYLAKFIIKVWVFYLFLMIVFPRFLGSWIFRNRINVLPGEFFAYIQNRKLFQFWHETDVKNLWENPAFSKVKGMIYIVIFLLLLACIWKVLDEFSVLRNICGMAVARNGNGSIFPFVNDSKFCRKLQWSQIVEFFLSIIYMLVWKKITDHFR